jgi:hypothetical protein
MLGAVLIAVPAYVHGQTIVTVRVTDSAAAPLANVELSVLHKLKPIATSLRTNTDGRSVLRLRIDSGSYEVVARRVGFQRAGRFMTVRGGDSLDLSIVMTRLAQALAPTKISASSDLKRRRLFIDADALAAARPEDEIDTGLDIIRVLRPDMVYGLGGRHVCPAVKDIWVNGRRIIPQFVIDDPTVRKTRQARLLPSHIATVLASIRPEHIAEMSSHDCMDMSVGKIRSENAIFVVLKPGIGYEINRGSFVADTTYPLAARRDAPDSVIRQETIRADSAVSRVSRSYASRLIGVFDFITGSPIDSCDVVDVSTGTLARTTETGTATLAFLPDGDWKIEIRKVGYQAQTLSVKIAPADTTPITVLLTRAP